MSSDESGDQWDHDDDEEFRRYLASVEHKLDRILHWLWKATDEIGKATTAAEVGLADRTARILDDWKLQEKALHSKLLNAAAEHGLGRFETVDELAHRFRFDPAFNESPVAGHFSDFRSLELQFREEHGVVLSGQARNFIYFGAVISLHAILEQFLRAVCEMVQRHRKSRLAMEDLKANGFVYRARDYLSKVHLIDPPTESWSGLQDFITIRNCIAHESGFVTRPGDVTSLSRRSDVKIEDGQVWLTKKFVEEFEIAIHKLSSLLDEQIRNWAQIKAVGRGQQSSGSAH